MTNSSATRRQTLLAGAVLSLAAATPAFAAAQSNSNQTKGARSMSQPFVTTRDGVEIFYKDWGPKDAQPVVFHSRAIACSLTIVAAMAAHRR
jgi:non-heme chloroperoxidase